MLKIKVNGEKMEIPTGWEDITLQDYERWYMNKPETRLDIIRHVADICKIEDKVLLDAPVDVFDLITQYISFALNENFEPANKIEIDGTQYRVSSSENLTLGEWVDADAVMSNDKDDKLSGLLAILCRPIGESYEPDKSEERKKLFRAQRCDKVLPLISFFLSKKRISDKLSSLYSMAGIQADQYLKVIKTSLINGAGTKRLPIWQAIKFYISIRLQRKKLRKFLDSSSTK